MIANLDQVPLSAAAYLAWEEQQELRYEYLDGRVYVPFGGCRGHVCL